LARLLERQFGELAPVDIDQGEGRPREERVASTARALGLTRPIALDDGSTADAYQVTSIPQTVLIGPDGKVVSAYYGEYPPDEFERAIRAAAR
jgi:hypothetical protein